MSTQGPEKITCVANFAQVSEWQHAHQPDALVTAPSRVVKALEWYQIAAVLHGPSEKNE
jgi:hypothetical protein